MADKKVENRRSSTGKEKVPPKPVAPYKFDVPSWAGKPPPGLHLDVMKGDKLVEKLIIDEKSYYLFGRNKDQVDFTIDHASCSRVHAALIFHRHLQRMFIMDLGSTHGTFIGTMRVDSKRPMQLQVDVTISFGASTRTYTLREKPSHSQATENQGIIVNTKENTENDHGSHSLLGLPESDTELDDLTEFNTAHNKRLATVPVEESGTVSRKRRRSSNAHVQFREGEEIINPEDIDPSVGRFRNLVQTEVFVPNKKAKFGLPLVSPTSDGTLRRTQALATNDLYSDLPHIDENHHQTSGTPSKFRITSAPEVEAPDLLKEKVKARAEVKVAAIAKENLSQEPIKKKYAKEAWPGKKPTQNLLNV